MTLADLGAVVFPAALGALAGFVPGVIVGRVDWNQRVSYWRQRALFKPRSEPPAPHAPSARLHLAKEPHRDSDTRTEAA